jgi:hypothetical protein
MPATLEAPPVEECGVQYVCAVGTYTCTLPKGHKEEIHHDKVKNKRFEQIGPGTAKLVRDPSR